MVEKKFILRDRPHLFIFNCHEPCSCIPTSDTEHMSHEIYKIPIIGLVVDMFSF